ncbi:hypothetical protein MMC26_006816 [Xylographa opegraphella]|nr:hypothetical protein [Xylographa opegraphella]
MIGAYQPPLMEIAQDTLPELQPIFTFLNSHSNKLYQEGYFLKLNDLDSHGRPYADRSWTECFAQLVGTVLSLWDAALLDEAGEDGEVAPTFINLADASIKMIETLPTRSQDVQPLANVLSISTAGKNRYLFHFSNVNALTQWTAGIRLAMYEHTTLQEAYTGSLIAGKGKTLNNIRVIMDRTKLVTEEWTRVRFGAGTPWRRCWCVISPPNEKEVLKQQKSLKKKSAYDLKSVTLKGDIKFYDTKKTKKVEPIATIRDAYSAYAIYPQSKPLIDQSTLVKIEGMITIHSKPEATTEGFIFVMPETRPAITGFEMMLRFLFPVYDTFGLYGRPTRLIADILDTRSLMFAMPQERRYGYLEILDVATLIHTDGSQGWNESEWRKQLKLLTSQRIAKIQASGSRTGSRVGSRRSHRNSLPARTDQLRYEDGASIRSTPSLHREVGPFAPPPHTGSAPVGSGPFQPPQKSLTHQRSVSETTPFSTPRRQRTIQEGSPNYTPSRLSYEQHVPRESYEPIPPPPPVHGLPAAYVRNPQVQRYTGDIDGPNERSSSESERRYRSPTEPHNHAQNIQQGLSPNAPPAPVATPPAFAHQPGAKPQTRPYHSPELRRANSRMSSTTLSQLAAAGNVSSSGGGGATSGGVAMAGAAAAWKGNSQQRDERRPEDQTANAAAGNNFGSHASVDRFQPDGMALVGVGQHRRTDQRQARTGLTINPQQGDPAVTPENLSPTSRSFLAPTPTSPRSVSPLSQSTSYAASPPPQEPAAAAVVQASRHDAANNPTIVDDDATSSADIAGQPTSSLHDERPDLRRHSTSRSISRKPLPSPSKVDVPPVPKHYSTVDDTVQAPRGFSNDERRQSMQSSNYDEESTASPDYASARQSVETGRQAVPVEKPRTGVLKTVGTMDPADQVVTIGDARYRPDIGAQQYTISALPAVDFGPTQAYRPDLVQQAHATTGSYNRPSSSPHYETQENVGRGGQGRSSPGDSYSSRNLVTPEPNNRRSGSADSDTENRRNVAWQPGMTAGSGSPGARQAITPEQFVQQRAAANRVVPVYSHGRQQSGTPPLHSHQSSGDLSGQYVNQDPPSRPHSRGASTVMNASPDYSARLSAREQEHVARVTGSPLINVAGNNPRSGPSSGGLVGAIEAREQEKKAMKQGVSGQMVQQAIAQRQQHAQAQGYANQGPQYANQSSQYPQPSPQMHVPGGYPQTPQMPYGGFSSPQQQQQYLMNQQYGQQQQYDSGASVYWNTAPSPYLHYPPTPAGGQRSRQSPGPLSPQYNPYFNNNSQGGP